MFTLNSKMRKFTSVLVGAVLTLTMMANVESARASFAPAIMATINPSSGTVTGGDLVTITGQNLDSVNTIKVGDQTVYWDDVEKSPIGEWITFKTPYSSKVGPADVTFLSNVNVTEPNFFTYTASSITSVAPALGTYRGGTTVTLKGTGFGPMDWGNSSLIVKFNGVNATGVKRVSPTQITAVTPAGVIGDADIEVSFGNDPRRTSTKFSANVIRLAKGYLFTAEVLAPKVDSVTPDRGSVTGGTQVTVSGRYLRGSDQLPATFSFGGALATNVVVSQDGLTATMTTPARPAGSVSLVVKNADSSTTLTDAYSYASAPTITSLSPATGVVPGGTLVTINGTNFGASGIPIVKFGDNVGLCVKLVSPTQITVVTRPGSLGAVNVEVTPTTGGGTANRAGSYTFQNPVVEPVISSISPDRGPTTGANTVEFKTAGVFPAGTPNVMFGSSCALTVTRVDDKTIRATAPSNPAGARNVGITFSNGYSFLANGYTYFVPAPPEISKVTPAFDWAQGGATVVIDGLGFGFSGTPVVKFGSVAATNVVRISNTQVSATAPAGTVGLKEVSVTPVGGTAITKTGAFTYKAPLISSVKPNSGVVLGGTNIQIIGDGFGTTGTPVVKIGGKLATNVVRIDNFKISATTPSGVKGFAAVEVTPQGGVAISSSTVFAYFELQVAPQIDESSVTWLPPAGGTPVTVRGKNFIGTDGKAGKVYVNGALVAATVSADGTSVTFTPQALPPTRGAYEFRIVTNEGTAWKEIFRVATPPSSPDSGCDGITGGGRNIDALGSRTVYLNNNSLMLSELGNPSVTVNGTESPIVVAGNTGGDFPRDFVTFDIPTSPAIALGDVTVVVKMGQNAGSLTNNCFYRRGDISISANDKTIMFGQDPGAFLKTIVGERGSDKVTSVVLTFTGIDGTNYPASTTAPTAAGRYQIRPSDAQMNPGTWGHYFWNYYDSVFVIQGIPVTVKATQCTNKIYGNLNPVLSYIQTGLPASESIKTGSVTYMFDGITVNGDDYGPTTVWPTQAGSYSISPRDAVLNSEFTSSISFTYESCNYEITKRPVSIKAPDTTKVYGSADPARPWVFTDASNKNLATGDSTLQAPTNVDRVEGENVGSYDYLAASFNEANPNYEITYSYWGKLTITKKNISVIGTDTTKNYCEADPEFTYTSSEIVFDDILSGSLGRAAGDNIGNYAYTRGTLSGGNNYTIDSISGKLTITTCPLAVYANYVEKVYGAVDPTIGYSFVGDYNLINGDTLTGALTRAAGSSIGTYAINQGTLASSPNYAITFHTNSFVITKRPICVSTDNKSKDYGSADPVFTTTLVTNSDCYSLIGSDSITGSLSRESGKDVGYYAITPGSLTAGPNYDLSIASGSLEITKRAITVSPVAKSKTYGDSDPVLTVAVTSGALAYSDSLVGSISRVENENAGVYDFVLGDFASSNPNYDITVDNTNKFTINKKRISVTGVDSQKYYGESDPELGYTSSGLVGGDSLSGALGRAAGEDVGNYSYTAGNLTGGDNYIVDSVTGGKLVIAKRPVDVCADAQSKTYGDSDPLLTYSVCGEFGLVGSDSFTGVLSRAAGEDVGDYAIGQNSLALSANYTLSFTGNNFRIDPKTIYLTAVNKTKVYGNADPEFTYSLDSGYAWVGVDVPTVSLTRDSGEDVGFYNITVGSVTGGSNYDIQTSSGSLEITRRAITVTPAAKSKTYGDSDPVLTVAVTSGALAYSDSLVGSISRVENENAGVYDFVLGDFASSNPNYDITVDNTNKFTINKKRISVTGVDSQKYYGESDPELGYTSSGLVGGDSLSGALGRAAGEDVGNYSYTAGNLTGGDNYIVDSVTGGKLVIAKRPVDVCADAQSKTYGDSDPLLTYSVCGEFGLVGSDSFTGVLSRAAGEDVGDYAIGQNSLALSANYTLSFTGNNFRIDPKTIYLTAVNKTKVYGNADPEFTYSLDSGYAWVGVDVPTVSLTRDSGEDVGFYNITVGSVTGGSNYDIQTSSGSLEITKLSLTVKPNATSKVYGEYDPDFTSFSASDYTLTSGALQFGDALVLAMGRESGEDVGSYNYTSGDLNSSNTNYDITLDSSNKFSITARSLTVTADANSKVYGENDPQLTYSLSISSLPNGSQVNLNGSLSRTSGEAVSSVGYAINQGDITNAANPNFSITYVSDKLKITQLYLALCADDKEMTYGDSLPDNSYSICDGTATVFGDTVSGATYSYSTDNPTDAGDYAITPSAATFSSGLDSNYSISYFNGTLRVLKKAITVTAANKTKMYGDEDPEFTQSVTSGSLVGSDSLTGSITREPGNAVGNYSIQQGNLTASGNYDLTFVDGTLEITQRNITVKPDGNTKVYGEIDPTLTFTVSVGTLPYGDTLGGQLTRAEGENADSYLVNLGDLSSSNPNYNISLDSSNQFKITKRAITVTAEVKSKEFGEVDPGLTYVTSVTDLPNGGVVSLSGDLSRVVGEDVADYNIIQGTVIDANNLNYTITFVGAELSITKRNVALCADDKEMTYGDSLPDNSYSICDGTATVFGDTVSGATYSYSTDNPTDAGDYAITPSAATFSSGLDSNYSISYFNGTLRVLKKAITVTAANKTKMYGDEDPEFTQSVTSGSLVGSDSLTGSITREPGNAVGNYSIQQGNLTASGNYDLTFVDGTLEITQRNITVKPDGNTKVYGEIDPTLTFTVSVGTLPYGDTLGGQLTRAEGENADSYLVNLGDLSSSNPNYNISLDSSNQFKITKRAITVTAEVKSKEFGEVDPGLTYVTSVTDLPNGGVVSLSGDLSRVVGEDVADYNIIQGTVIDANNLNYTITFVGAELSITKRNVTVCVEDKLMTYGDSRPVNSFVVCAETSLVGSDVLGSASYAYSTATPVNVGDYTITGSAAVLSSGSAGNYNFSYQDGTLTIGKRLVEVTAADKLKSYGQVDPVFTYIVSSGSLVGSDAFTGVLARESGENVGDYGITLGDLSLGSNYDLSVTGGKLTINKLAVKVVPSAGQKKTFGDVDPVFTYTTDVVLPFAESLTGDLGRDSGEDATDYAFTLGSVGSGASNYDITIDTTSKFTIEKFALSITVDSLEKFYGEDDPTYTYTLSSETLANGDSIVLTGSLTRVEGQNVGQYVISAGSLTPGSNFATTISTGAKLTIKKVAITLTADNQSTAYGTSLPENSVTVTSGTLVGSETISSTTYTYSTNPPKNVGTYTITPSAALIGGGLASNYDLTYVDGELTITKASLTIYLSDSNSDWGDPIVPAKPSGAEGLVTGDKLGTFDYTYDESETAPLLPGTFALNGTVASFAAGSPDNYEITIVPATYTINAPFFVSIDPPSGPEAGGTRFSILGFGFGLNNPVVQFDGIEATSVKLVGSTQITGVTPPHAQGPVAVTLITDAGTLELGEVFTYIPPKPRPQISALAPIQGTTTGGTKVTLSGVALKGTDGKVAKIYVDGVLATGVKVSADGTTLEFITPKNSAGPADVKVVTKEGEFTFAGGFKYIPGARTSSTSTSFIVFGGDSSVLQKPAIAGLQKLIKGIPKGAKVITIKISGWVKRTASTAIDAKLSLARANVTASFLKKAGIKGKYVIKGNGIYRLGNDQDRRAEIEIIWIK